MKYRIQHLNYPMLLRVLGWLLLIESCFMAIPTVTALAYGETDAIAFVGTLCVTALVGGLLTMFLKPERTDMGRREGFLLTASVWVVFSVFGMLPFMFCSAPISLSDAFFEAMSGFTTTGCSVLTSVEGMSHSIMLWRALMQWIGGMGIILFTLAVLPMLNYSGGMQMFNAEVTGIVHEKLRPRISSTAKTLWLIYVSLTALLILLLWLGPMDIFDSVCHAFSAMSTGGFSTHDNSLAYYNSDYVTIVVTIFMFFGGTSFALMFKIFSGDRKALWHNDVFQTYIFIIGAFYVAFVCSLFYRHQVGDWRDVTIYPLFQIVSTITSTGLSVCNFEKWGPFILSLIMVLMFTGACAGSTSGGAKIDRMLFLVKNSHNELYKCVHPNAVTNVRINDKVVPSPLVSKVIAFLCIYVMVIAIGGIALTALGLPIVDSFFSSFSCVSNTGFGAGMTGQA
ncbi:MAG: TrkH family potassium uptake protein, partial [Bacteroides sp.]|nr:TrkH family potassium uptake protein [Bacteroides sp.]